MAADIFTTAGPGSDPWRLPAPCPRALLARTAALAAVSGPAGPATTAPAPSSMPSCSPHGSACMWRTAPSRRRMLTSTLKTPNSP